MLTAHRFTVVLTKDCRDRLEEAFSNSKPISRGERSRAAVVAIQSALADLNRGYLSPGDIDGYYGPSTSNAVEAFQRDYGLAADGMVGRQTMGQLDSLYSSDVVRIPIGRSLHIGVDHLDAGHYKSDFALGSCVNDAHKMREIAESLGYSAATLENEEATTTAFTGFMRQAIDDLCAGDSLLVSFSGHGSQLPNTSDDDEPDLLDETLCFYDRMLIDDELYALFAQFKEGVRVHLVFDSCHSGTVYKDILTAPPKSVEVVVKEYHDVTLGTIKELTSVTVVQVAGGAPGDDKVSGQPITAQSLTKALDGEKPELQEPPKPTKDLSDDVAQLFAQLKGDTVPRRPNGQDKGNLKVIEPPDSFPIYNDNKALYDAIKNVVGSQTGVSLACTLVTLSACQDSQTTPAGQVYSLFTYNICNAWSSGSFTGSYSQFHTMLKSVSPPTSTPEIHSDGVGRGEARLYDRPFVL